MITEWEELANAYAKNYCDKNYADDEIPFLAGFEAATRIYDDKILQAIDDLNLKPCRKCGGSRFGLPYRESCSCADFVYNVLNEKEVRILELEKECSAYKEALGVIATPKRPDGTYNYCREACESLARNVLNKFKKEG